MKQELRNLLSEEEIILINRLKRKHLSLSDEADMTSSLPVISQDAVDQTLEDFNLRINFEGKIIPCEFSDVPVIKKGITIARRYLETVRDSNDERVLAEATNEIFNEYFSKHMNAERINTALSGYGFVFGTFHRELGVNFIDQLNYAVQTHDLHYITTEVMADSNGNRYNFDNRIHEAARIALPLHIPYDQPMLRDGVDIIKSQMNYEQAFEDGAIIGYQLIEKLWPRMQQFTPEFS